MNLRAEALALMRCFFRVHTILIKRAAIELQSGYPVTTTRHQFHSSWMGYAGVFISTGSGFPATRHSASSPLARRRTQVGMCRPLSKLPQAVCYASR